MVRYSKVSTVVLAAALIGALIILFALLFPLMPMR
jgi:hypothetical protein